MKDGWGDEKEVFSSSIKDEEEVCSFRMLGDFFSKKEMKFEASVVDVWWSPLRRASLMAPTRRERTLCWSKKRTSALVGWTFTSTNMGSTSMKRTHAG